MVYILKKILGSKIDDDGDCRWDCEDPRERSCFYGRSSRRRTNGCCGIFLQPFSSTHDLWIHGVPL